MFPMPLFVGDSSLITDHLNRLPPEDKRLRFGFYASDAAVSAYVSRSFTKNSLWYGYIDKGVCIGAVHVYISDDLETSEIGISIDPVHRGNGYSSALFSRAITHLEAFGVSKVSIQCLSENKAIQHIAKKHGMRMITIAPGEMMGETVLPERKIFNIDDGLCDTISLFDSFCRNHLWLWSELATIFKESKDV